MHAPARMMDALWFALRKAPRSVWAGLGLLALCGALITWSEARRTAAYERGKRDASAGVAFDSALVQRVAAIVAQRTAHTDTVIRVVTRTQTEVRTAIETLPDSLKAIPDVGRLVAVTTRLVVEVDSLKGAVSAERAAWVERAKVDSASIYSLRVIATARGDSVQALVKRPRWRTVVVGSLTGAATGAVAVLLRR